MQLANNPVLPGLYPDHSKDQYLTDFGKATLQDTYLLPNESYQDAFLRVAKAHADDEEHAARIYSYMSRLWFMPATPILSNSGTNRGLTISCFLNNVSDSLGGIVDSWNENIWLSAKGGGIGTYWGDVREIGAVVNQVGKTSGIIPFIKVQESLSVAISQGCVDGETELLTEKGWIKFSEVSKKHGKVAQVNEDKSISFVYPLGFHQYKFSGNLHHYTNVSNSVDHLVTPNHRMVYEKTVRQNNKKTFSGKLSIRESEKLKMHRDNRFYTSGNSSVGEYKSTLSVYEQFLIAYQADGSGIVGSLDNCSTTCLSKSAYNITFKKNHKAVILRDLLNQLGFTYNETYSKKKGWVFAVFIPLQFNIKKDFSWIDLTQINTLWARDFISCFSKWHDVDSSTSYKIYKLEDKSVVNSISAVACLAGYRCSVDSIMLKRSKRSVAILKEGYKTVIDTELNTVGGESIKKNMFPYEGMVYCVSVPSGIFLARRRGRTLVTGNSLRRGSCAVYLPVWHPEIEEFLEIRKPTGGDPERKTLNINHAVVIDDLFMEAVKHNLDYNLRSQHDNSVVKTLKARELWIKILTIRVETGEPYILFIDNVNKSLPAHHDYLGLGVKTSNLCSEITLPTGKDYAGETRTAVCCLSSLNLEKYDEWKNDPYFIEDVLTFLDNVLQGFIDNAPKQMKNAIYSALMERSVGLGVMGFHSYLQSKMIPWESALAKSINFQMFKHIKSEADKANKTLAEDRECCPDSVEAMKRYIQHRCSSFNDINPIPLTMLEEFREKAFEKYGRRFSNMLAIAPTANISIICGGTSPGIEPRVANCYTHKTQKGSFSIKNPFLVSLLESKNQNKEEIWSSIANNIGSVSHLDFLTDDEKAVFKTAYELDQRWIIEFASDRQPYICQSQSVNVFLPGTVNKTDLHMIHFKAWELGLKSLYYCRSLTSKRPEDITQKIKTEERELYTGDAAKYQECLACQ